MSTQLVSYNPATDEVVGQVPVTPAHEIAAVVDCARAAQPAWSRIGLAARAEALRPAGEAILARSDELGALLTAEMGKPLREATSEVRSCGAGLAGGLDEIIEALSPQTLTDSRTRTTLYRDPYGVCATISPWNFPMSMAHGMSVPALMAGNTVVIKPSEETPLIAQAWAEILAEHLPTDVIQIVHGADAQGKALVAADVDLVAFTGSRAAGAHILTAAGPDLKRVILELGGKDPLVVLDDADLDAAARFAVRNSFRNAGQVCVSTERIYVAAGIAEAFEQRFLEVTQELNVGAGTDEGVDIGPMVSARQKGMVLDQVRDAVERGATVALGSTEGGPGNFLLPIVLTDVHHGLPIMRDETFGPVACIQRFSNDEEAVALANDTPYGLGAVVFGSDPERSEGVARQLEAGMVGINRGVGGARGAPWVGAKQSGYGFHSGPEGHRQFAQVRIVSAAV